MAGLEAVRSAAFAGLIRPASDFGDPATAAGGADRVLPVLPELSRVLPGRGLRRGSTIAVTTGRSAWPAGGSSLLLALLAYASRTGSWCAVVGVPTFGAMAAIEVGISLERLALVPYPGPEWPTVVAALMDGVDVVVVAAPNTVTGSIAGRLAARARQRGSVLVPYGHWTGADVTLQVMRGVWEGLGQGRGRLRCRQVTIAARGRGAAARPKEVTVWMPAASGGFGAAAAAVPLAPVAAAGKAAGGARQRLALEPLPEPRKPRHLTSAGHSFWKGSLVSAITAGAGGAGRTGDVDGGDGAGDGDGYGDGARNVGEAV